MFVEPHIDRVRERIPDSRSCVIVEDDREVDLNVISGRNSDKLRVVEYVKLSRLLVLELTSEPSGVLTPVLAFTRHAVLAT
jgi:hypothetical protein